MMRSLMCSVTAAHVVILETEMYISVTKKKNIYIKITMEKSDNG